jgi:hypothetical protein
MSLINRCTRKPLSVYIEKNDLKLVYRYFDGYLLSKKIVEKPVSDKRNLKDFLIRVLFLLHDL